MIHQDSDAPTAHHFLSQRLRLHYLDWGNDGAPTVILIHGGRDHARSWDWVARDLRADYHVIVPDLRGHGDSAWSPDGAYAMPYLVNDLAMLIDRCDGPVSIVAHSAGAAVALRYVGLYPDRVQRLAAIEGIGLNDEQRDFADRWRDFIAAQKAMAERRPRLYPSFEAALERMRTENPHLSDAQVAHLTTHGVVAHADGGFGWKFDPYVRARYPTDISDGELRSLWRAITCPVWLVHGADSWAKHPSDGGRAAEFRDAHVTSFADAGHWPHHDRFADFVTALKAFLV